MDLGSGSRLTPCLDIGKVVLLRKCFRKLPLLGLPGLYLSAPCAKWSIHNLRLLPLRIGTVRPRSPPHSPARTSRSWKFCLLRPRQRPSPGRQHSPHLVLNSHPTQCRRAELWWLGRQWEGAGSWWLSTVSRWFFSAWLFTTDVSQQSMGSDMKSIEANSGIPRWKQSVQLKILKTWRLVIASRWWWVSVEWILENNCKTCCVRVISPTELRVVWKFYSETRSTSTNKLMLYY